LQGELEKVLDAPISLRGKPHRGKSDDVAIICKRGERREGAKGRIASGQRGKGILPSPHSRGGKTVTRGSGRRTRLWRWRDVQGLPRSSLRRKRGGKRMGTSERNWKKGGCPAFHHRKGGGTLFFLLGGERKRGRSYGKKESIGGKKYVRRLRTGS